MPPLNLSSLKPGDVLRQAVYTPQGAKVLSRGVTLTSEQISALRFSHARLLLGFPTNRHAAIAGAAPLEPYADNTAPDMEAAANLSPTAWRRRIRLADAFVADRARRWASMPLRTSDALEPLLSPDDYRSADHVAQHAAMLDGARRRPDWTSEHARTLESIAQGRSVDLTAETQPIVDEMLRFLCAAPTRFSALAFLHVRDADYLPSHAVASAILAMSIAARLGHDEPHVRLIAYAALFCDVGMASLSPDLLLSDRPLDEVSLNRVRRHPAISVAMLSATTSLDDRALCVIYQHHERDNGSGYPRALRAGAIHDLAKVLAVADVFAAATAHRPYRLAQHRPADGLAEAVRLANAGVLDRAATLALLESVGRYPVGSYVRLTTGERALVVASNPDRFDLPLVQPLGDNAAPAGALIDLALPTPRAASIVGPAEPPASGPSMRPGLAA